MCCVGGINYQYVTIVQLRTPKNYPVFFLCCQGTLWGTEEGAIVGSPTCEAIAGCGTTGDRTVVMVSQYVFSRHSFAPL